jgi:hypothetical protein
VREEALTICHLGARQAGLPSAIPPSFAIFRNVRSQPILFHEPGVDALRRTRPHETIDPRSGVRQRVPEQSLGDRQVVDVPFRAEIPPSGGRARCGVNRAPSCCSTIRRKREPSVRACCGLPPLPGNDAVEVAFLSRIGKWSIRWRSILSTVQGGGALLGLACFSFLYSEKQKSFRSILHQRFSSIGSFRCFELRSKCQFLEGGFPSLQDGLTIGDTR